MTLLIVISEEVRSKIIILPTSHVSITILPLIMYLCADHLMAMKMIDSAHKRGGRVQSFVSYCGGLPSPEAANNPLGYKFRSADQLIKNRHQLQCYFFLIVFKFLNGFEHCKS